MPGVTNEELLERIFHRFEEGWGKYIEIRSGWNDLVSLTDEALSRADPDYRIRQIKEKFGGLRLYVQPSKKLTPVDSFTFFAIIRHAESISMHTCEMCGDRAGKQREDQTYVVVHTESTTIGGWVNTLCTICREKDRERVRNR